MKTEPPKYTHYPVDFYLQRHVIDHADYDETQVQFETLGVELPEQWGDATREQLLKAVWTTPHYKIADIWRIGHATLMKLCEKKNVPLPNRAFWAAVKKKKLPTGKVHHAFIARNTRKLKEGNLRETIKSGYRETCGSNTGIKDRHTHTA